MKLNKNCLWVFSILNVTEVNVVSFIRKFGRRRICFEIIERRRCFNLGDLKYLFIKSRSIFF